MSSITLGDDLSDLYRERSDWVDLNWQKPCPADTSHLPCLGKSLVSQSGSLRLRFDPQGLKSREKILLEGPKLTITFPTIKPPLSYVPPIVNPPQQQTDDKPTEIKLTTLGAIAMVMLPATMMVCGLLKVFPICISAILFVSGYMAFGFLTPFAFLNGFELGSPSHYQHYLLPMHLNPYYQSNWY